MRLAPSLLLICLSAGAIAAAAIALADPGDSKPASPPATTPAAQPAAAPDAKPAVKPEFPKIVQKRLFAKNDLRGKAAPKFEVEKWLSSEPKRDAKVILIDFWATWCAPCRALIPELNDLHSKLKDDLIIVGISDEKADIVSKFMEKTKVNYAMAIDTKSKMKNALDVQGIPHVMVIDSTGIVRWQGFPQGEEKLTEAVLKQIIDADKAQRAAKKN